ncbi:MAG: hypothetical protein HRU41_24665 [Saprospiraceae bacterium]|nr:hypothetical protein [Saprospiraceae bacterium]
MKFRKPIRSILLFVLLYPSFLKAHAVSQLDAILKASTTNREGILTRVVNLSRAKWKMQGLQFRFHRRIRGTKKFHLLNEKWGTYQKFDITAVPGVWYEFVIEVRGKGLPATILDVEPVSGFRPPAGIIPTYFGMENLSQDEEYLYLNSHFKDTNGNSLFSDEAIIHIRTREKLPWYEIHGIHQEYLYKEFTAGNPNVRIKKSLGTTEIEACLMLQKKDSISVFHCRKIDLGTVPVRKSKSKPASKGKKDPMAYEPDLKGRAPGYVMRTYSKFLASAKFHQGLLLSPFSTYAIRCQSQKQRIIRRVS